MLLTKYLRCANNLRVAGGAKLHHTKMRFSKLIASVFLTTIVLPAICCGQDTNNTDKGSPTPGQIDVEHSRIYVFVDKSGLGHQHAVEAKLASGMLNLGASENAGKIIFDMTSFDADTDRARRYLGLQGSTDQSTREAVNENMRGADILNVSAFPTASFEVLTATSTGKTTKNGYPVFVLEGQFALHDRKRPVKILAEVTQVNGWLHIRGSFSFKQTDFGIKPYSKAFGAIGVADELRVYGDLYVVPTERISMSDIPQKQN